jgi:hypothetical protein
LKNLDSLDLPILGHNGRTVSAPRAAKEQLRVAAFLVAKKE